MVRYQVLNTTDTKDLYTIFRYINNTATEGLFFPIMLLVIWIVAFLGVIADGRQLSRGFTFASFICAIIAILLVLLNVLTPIYMYFLFVLTAIGILWIYLSNSFD
jgi:fumarate reductase subunit D